MKSLTSAPVGLKNMNPVGLWGSNEGDVEAVCGDGEEETHGEAIPPRHTTDINAVRTLWAVHSLLSSRVLPLRASLFF
jgi:hypothetical protein